MQSGGASRDPSVTPPKRRDSQHEREMREKLLVRTVSDATAAAQSPTLSERGDDNADDNDETMNRLNPDNVLEKIGVKRISARSLFLSNICLNDLRTNKHVCTHNICVDVRRLDV